jgi:hypothetical protein
MVGVSDLDASKLMPCVRLYVDVVTTTTDFWDLVENRRIACGGAGAIPADPAGKKQHDEIVGKGVGAS